MCIVFFKWKVFKSDRFFFKILSQVDKTNTSNEIRVCLDCKIEWPPEADRTGGQWRVVNF